jgi:DnaJ-domain-containing protein 1
MSPAEILVSVICLVVGYWLVNTLMQKGPTVRGDNAKPDAGTRTPPPGAGASAQPPRAVAAESAAWHEVLGVSRNATHADVAAAYRARISEYHPDKVAKMGAEIRAVAERKSKQINIAYAEALKVVRE